MNFAIHLYLIKGVMLGFEIVEEADESNWLVIDLLICRIMFEFGGSGE
jgi:hypothetical protein